MGEAGQERTLREADRRSGWDDAERLANLGCLGVGRRDQTLTWSDEMYRIFGIDPEGPAGLDSYATARSTTTTATHVGVAIQRLASRPRALRVRVPGRPARRRGPLAALAGGGDADARRRASLRITGFGQDVTERHLAETSPDGRTGAAGPPRGGPRADRPQRADGETLAGSAVEIEERYPEARCSVLLVDAASRVLHHAAGAVAARRGGGRPRRPARGRAGMGACGTAAFRRGSRWWSTTPWPTRSRRHSVDLAVTHDLRSVWSQPLLDPDGEALGTFAVYRPEPHEPDAEEIEIGAFRRRTGRAGHRRERTVSGR